MENSNKDEFFRGQSEPGLADTFIEWFTQTFRDADGSLDHLPDWLQADVRKAWDASAKVERAKCARAVRELGPSMSPGALASALERRADRLDNVSEPK
jgi:hypothetical protein